MLSPYITVTIICLLIIVGVVLYIVTRRPRVTLDDGNHRFLYALVVTSLVVGLVFGAIHVWSVTR